MLRIPGVLILFLLGTVLAAQPVSGRITYKRTTHWIRILEDLPYISQAEKDRATLTWGDDDHNFSLYSLRFTPEESVYTHEDPNGTEDIWTWRKDDYLIHRNWATMTRQDLVEMLDRTYIIEDDLHFPKWKILSEIKDIEGYVCMSAETRDTIKGQRIVAWFTDQIPVPAGPEMSGGLPGMILELEVNDGAMVVTATAIDLNLPEDGLGLPKKWKGKRIDEAKYTNMIRTYLADAVDAQRNPYWSLRY